MVAGMATWGGDLLSPGNTTSRRKRLYGRRHRRRNERSGKTNHLMSLQRPEIPTPRGCAHSGVTRARERDARRHTAGGGFMSRP